MKEKSTKIWFWTALILSWLTFVTILTSPIGLLVWFIALTILFIRKTNLKWYLIGLSAWTVIPTFSFISGTMDYFRGQAKFRYVGLPDGEFFNLDKEFRVWNSTSGCIVLGYEPLFHKPNNLAITTWTKLLGYQNDIYTGLYPDKTSSNKILDSIGKKVNFVNGESLFEFYLDKKKYSLDLTKGKIFIIQKPYSDSGIVSINNNELIIVRPFTKDEEIITYLADIKTGKIFAKYYTENKEGTNR